MANAAPLPTVAVYGLGIIGSRAAEHLARAGYPLRTWSRSVRDRDDFVSDAAEAAAGAEVLALYLKDAPAVRTVFEAVRPRLGPGVTVLNHATIDLDTTDWLADECHSAGADFFNAPFTGSKVAAGKGALVYYAGGSPALLAKLRPLLEATSCRILEVADARAATVLKLTTNLISASTVQALAEGLALNAAHGNDAATYLEAIKPNACASVLAEMKVPGMAAGDFDPHFSLSNMLKDARYMLDLSAKAGIETPGIATTAEQMQRLDEAGHGEKDFSVLYRQFGNPDA